MAAPEEPEEEDEGASRRVTCHHEVVCVARALTVLRFLQREVPTKRRPGDLERSVLTRACPPKRVLGSRRLRRAVSFRPAIVEIIIRLFCHHHGAFTDALAHRASERLSCR
jgi:hypothetical protein